MRKAHKEITDRAVDWKIEETSDQGGRMLSRKQSEAFEAFRDIARASEALSDREKLFVQFAAAISMGCQP